MRRVLRNHHEVAHFWSHARQDEGSATNVFFVGDTIYSYGRHFPIARRLSYGVYALTTRGYSVSTAKHKGIVHNAIPHGATVLHVADPTMPASLSNRRDYERRIEVALLATQRPRIRQATRDAEQAAALSLADQFNAYAEAVGSAERIDVSQFADIDKLRAALVERDRLAAAAAAEAERVAGLELAEKVEMWRIHKGGVSASHIYRAPVALRMTRGGVEFIGDMVETSRGAEIPVEAAKRLWPVIQRAMAGERDYEVGMDLGGYRLTKIRRDGSVVVGCHDISHSEIQRIAQQLGLMEEVPA